MARPSKPGKAPTRRKTSTTSSDATTAPGEALPADRAADTTSDQTQTPGSNEKPLSPDQDAYASAQEHTPMADPTTSTRVTPVPPVEAADSIADQTELTPPTDTPSEEVTAAVVVDEKTTDADVVADVDAAGRSTEADAPTDLAGTDTLASATGSNDTLTTDSASETTAEKSHDPTDVPPPGTQGDAADSAPPPPPPVTPPPPARAGFFPLVLGGIVAAGIGFGAAQLMGPMGTQTTDLSARLADLEGRVTLMSGELATQIGDLSAAANDDPLATVLPMIDGLTARLDAQDARLVTLSETDDTSDQLTVALAELDTRVSEQVSTTLSEPLADLAALRDDISSRQEGLRADIESLRALAETRVAEAEADAADAANRAARAAARLALGDIAAAFDSGAPFDPALADVSTAGVDIPAALRDAAETGVPTLSELQDSFTPAARRALGASLSAVDAGSVTDRFALFLRSQTNARSLSARDGDDPDAILSRAEAALRAGRVASAINELDALPDAGRAAMVDWIAQAQLRADATAGLTMLQNQLTAE